MRQIRSYGTTMALCTLLLTGCGGGSGGDACDGWTCSDHGHCVVTDGEPGCDCDAFYEPSADGTGCVSIVQDPCQPYDCAGHGTCRVTAQDEPYCECVAGWFPTEDGLSCIENQCQGDCGDMGCCGQRCCLPLPTNAGVIGGLTDNGIARTAPGSFDTDADCAAGSALGDCELVAVPGAVDVCVCRLDSLTVPGGMRVTGSAALAVLAYSTISVNGTIDLAARGADGGPGAAAQADVEAASWRGGKGGSNGTAGGSSGDAPGPQTLNPLVGGQDGQAGCGGPAGGGGGGALQLVAGESITVSATVSAGGGGGAGGQNDPDGTCLGGAGGGSGGSLLLEAPAVTFSGAFYANGGSGGGGGNNTGASGEDGRDATASTQPVQGGQGRDGASCDLYGAIEGGDGGAGSAGDSPGSDGQDYDSNQCPGLFPYVGGGGGGGGAGRLRINARGDCACTGTFSPSPSYGYLQGG